MLHVLSRTSINYEAPLCVILSTLLLIHLSWVQIFILHIHAKYEEKLSSLGFRKEVGIIQDSKLNGTMHSPNLTLQ
jgi:hypothetical protein